MGGTVICLRHVHQAGPTVHFGTSSHGRTGPRRYPRRHPPPCVAGALAGGAPRPAAAVPVRNRPDTELAGAVDNVRVRLRSGYRTVVLPARRRKHHHNVTPAV